LHRDAEGAGDSTRPWSTTLTRLLNLKGHFETFRLGPPGCGSSLPLLAELLGRQSGRALSPAKPAKRNCRRILLFPFSHLRMNPARDTSPFSGLDSLVPGFCRGGFRWAKRLRIAVYLEVLDYAGESYVVTTDSLVQTPPPRSTRPCARCSFLRSPSVRPMCGGCARW
jgi:hypothetical protein